MADPLSIIGVIASAVSLSNKIYDYTNSFKDSARCVANLAAEATAVGNTLDTLRVLLESNAADSLAMKQTSALFSAAQGCKLRLQDIEEALAPFVSGSKTSRLLRRLKWPLDEEDTIREVEALHRYAQLFNFALTIDGFIILSESQSKALANIEKKLETALQSSQNHSDTILSQLGHVHTAVQNLPLLTSTVDDISAKLAQVVRNMSTVDDMSIKLDRVCLAATVSEQNRSKDEAEAGLELLLNALPALPYDDKHRDLQERRASDLGKWILDVPDFKLLCQGTLRPGALWCHGVPGAGKTYLTSHVIDHLESKEDTHVAYFYFDYREQSTQTPFALVSCVLRQILYRCHTLPNSALPLYRRLRDRKPLPTWRELTRTLVDVCGEVANVFLVFDALDECDEDTNREAILQVLKGVAESPARVFITSRPQCLDINRNLSGYPQVRVEATREDVEQFVARKINDSARMKAIIQGQLRRLVIDTIVDKSRGMFLLPALQIGNILSQNNETEVRKAIEELPSGLVRNLDLAIQRIKQQAAHSDSRQRQAMRTLLWLSHSKRPMKSIELQHAIAIDPRAQKFNPASVTKEELLVESCLGLVTVDTDTSIIRLVHLSVNEYLVERRESLFPNSHSSVALDCLTYLLFDDFDAPQFQSKDAMIEEQKVYPFLGYAAEYWGEHAADDFSLCLKAYAAAFFSRIRQFSRWGQLAIIADRNSEWHWRENIPVDLLFKSHTAPFSPRHVAARYGLDELLQGYYEGFGPSPNPRDWLGRTPLMLAAWKGHLSTASTLLGAPNTDPNLVDLGGFTALGLSIAEGHFDIARLLLTNDGVNPNLKFPLRDLPHRLGGPDSVATSIAELFMAHPRFDVNLELEVRYSSTEESSFWWIAEGFRPDLLGMMLAHNDFDPLRGGKAALLNRCASICEYDFSMEGVDPLDESDGLLTLDLLERDPRFTLPDFGWLKRALTILYVAYAGADAQLDKEPRLQDEVFFRRTEGNCKILRDALQKENITLQSVDSCGRGLLHYAVKIAHEPIVGFLISRGLPVNLLDINWTTPLHLASETGNKAIMERLLASGADVRFQNKAGHTPLHIAIKHDHESLAQELLHLGADPKAPDSGGLTPLHSAAEKGQVYLFNDLLAGGADPNAADKDGCTVLQAAAASENQTALGIVRTLLGRGADAAARTGEGWTAIHAAAGTKHGLARDVVQILHQHGGKVDMADFEGLTPLNLAAGDGKLDVVQYLLEHGADPNARALRGTPIQAAAESMDEAKVTALLKYRGDLDLLDIYGRSTRQRISGNMQLEQCSLSAAAAKAQADDSRGHLRLCIQQRLAAMMRDPSNRTSYTERLGLQLIAIGDDEAATIAFGVAFGYDRRNEGLRYDAECSECESLEEEGGRYVCRTCLTTKALFCKKCVEVPAAVRRRVLWCQLSHNSNMLHVPDDKWEKLPQGALNKQGQKYTEWLASLQEKYGGLEQPEIRAVVPTSTWMPPGLFWFRRGDPARS